MASKDAMGAELVIRRASVADAAAVADLGLRTFLDTFGPMNREEDVAIYVARTYGEEFQRREIEAPRAVTLIAEGGGVPAAFAQLRVAASPELALPEESVEIARFYVDRPWHGRGVAQALMAEVESIARSVGVEAIWLGVWERNARAIAFYTKCGFRDAGSHPFLLGTDLQTDRLMVKSLVE